MKENRKKEYSIKFTIENKEALDALKLINKEYSGIKDESQKITAGNNEVNNSLARITGSAGVAAQAFGQINAALKKPGNATGSVAANETNTLNNDYETEQKKYKELNKLASQYSKAINKIDDEDNKHKIRSAEHTLRSVESLFGKHTTAYKAFVVSSTMMDTYQAAEAAYKSAAEIPLVGFLMAPAVAAAATIAGMQRVNQISAVPVPGYAKGGAVVGENGPEIIAPFQDYASGQAKLITMTMMTLKNELSGSGVAHPANNGNKELLDELKTLNKNFEKYSQNPVTAKAFLDDREAKKIFNRGYAINNKGKI